MTQTEAIKGGTLPDGGETLPIGVRSRDVRAKHPPLLRFLLRIDTARRILRVLLLLGIDLVALQLALLTALTLKAAFYTEVDIGQIWAQACDYVPLVFLVTSLLFWREDLYAQRHMRPGMVRIVASLCSTMVVILLFAIASGQEFSSFYIFYGTLAFAVVYVTGSRFLFELGSGMVLSLAGYKRRTLLVGRGHQIDQVAHALDVGGHGDVTVAGCLSLTREPVGGGVASLGTFDQLERVLIDNTIDDVVIVDPEFPQREAVELVDICHRRGVATRIAPSTMEILVHRAEFVPGQSLPLFELKPPTFDGLDFQLKRTFDIIIATLMLLLLTPLLLVCALLVRLTSPGPVLYRSYRPGIGGRMFACLKFRTMYEDADRRQAELEAQNEASGALFKMRDDPRITPVGRFLRRYSLDELPQLINVLCGEMSLVGPRPLPARDFAQLESWHKKRYLVLPGLTGLWQVSGRSDLDFDDLVRLDFLYIERWSIFLDLTIMIKTVPAVLLRRGAF